jgi:glyoxylase-like metal-dependent hydrolase (beta-lactamase superfamily II)
MKPIAGVYELEVGTTKVFIITGKKNILVDAGLAPMPDAVLAFMEKTGMQLKDESQRQEMREGAYAKIIYFLKRENVTIDLIICTHYHLDHTGTVKRLKETLNVPIAMHPEDIPFVDGTQEVPIPSYIPQEIRPYLRIENCTVDRQLIDSEYIRDDVQVIHTPGHTRGSICLLVNKQVLIAGDTLIGKNEINPAAGLNELNPLSKQASLDYEQGIKSLHRLLTYDFTALFPTHGTSITERGKEKLEAMLRAIS